MAKHPDLCIILPIKDEQESIVSLLEDIVTNLETCPDLKSVLLIAVDDNSKDDGIARLQAWHKEQQYLALELEVLRLDTTHGLYMALLQGCKRAAQLAPCYTVILDADGQDNPVYIAQLLELAAVSEIVFAARGRRKDSRSFQICYHLFQLLMKLFSGKTFYISHYAMLQRHVLAEIAKLDYVDFFGALLYFSRFNRQYLIADRRERIAGESKFMFMQRLRLALTIFSYSRQAVMRVCCLGVGFTLACGLFTLVINSRLWASLALLSSAATLAMLLLFVSSFMKRIRPLG